MIKFLQLIYFFDFNVAVEYFCLVIVATFIDLKIFLFSVRFPEKIQEKDEEENFCTADPIGKCNREIAFDEKERETVRRHGNKLNNLKNRHVPLPFRDKSLNPRSHSRKQIIGIHNNMDKGVDQSTKMSISTVEEANSKTGDNWNEAMVAQVQKCNLVIFLTKDEKDCIN